jgi:hypothetical protein
MNSTLYYLFSFCFTILAPNVLLEGKWDSSVSYSDGLRAGRPLFGSRQGHDFSILHSVRTESGAQPAFCRVGTGD